MRMRRALWMLALAAAVAAAAGGVAPGRALGQCAFVVVRNDTAYFGYWSGAAAPHVDPGPSLRGAVAPGCNDTPGPIPSPVPAGAVRITGVTPAVAILLRGTIVIAAGYFPQSRGFPLVRTGAPVDDETRGCRLGPALTLTGTARPKPAGINLADVRSSRPVRLFDHKVIDLFVDGHTRLSDLARHGLAYVGDGQAVRIEARFCKVPGSVGRRIVARRIVAAGPIVPPSTAEDILGAGWRGSGGVIHQLGGTRRVVTAVVVLAVALMLVFLARARRRRSPTAGAG